MSQTPNLWHKGRDRGEGEFGWCQRCDREVALDGGPDPCLGMIPGVVAACCGHGLTEPYVVLANREPEAPCSGESWHEHPHLALYGAHATAFFRLVELAREAAGNTLGVNADDAAAAGEQTM